MFAVSQLWIVVEDKLSLFISYFMDNFDEQEKKKNSPVYWICISA